MAIKRVTVIERARTAARLIRLAQVGIMVALVATVGTAVVHVIVDDHSTFGRLMTGLISLMIVVVMVAAAGMYIVGLILRGGSRQER